MFIDAGLSFFILYILSLLFFLIGVLRIPKNRKIKLNKIEGVSVIVCVRNGQNSLPFILEDLKAQNFKYDLEFIIVDDESNDNTKKIIKKYADEDPRFKYLSTYNFKSKLRHKKRALDLGIKHSKHDWMLFTDVDCRVKSNWVNGMINNINFSNYIIGFSHVKEKNTFISRFQSVDFRMLMISACSSSFMNYPLACSGQNQLYNKNIYKVVNGFENISHLLQGDDSIFMQMCKKSQISKISFSIHPDSYVTAKTHSSWIDFIKQRIRWAGDANIMWKFNKSFFIVILSTFIANLFILSLVFLNTYNLLFQVLLIKFIFEYLLYMIGSKKMNVYINHLSFIFWFFIQIPYIVFMGGFSFISNQFSWRGR